MTTKAATLSERVAALGWYHTLELGPGVVTPGWFDTRTFIAQLPFPDSLRGRRCLDVGTFDGFWAFEMERRGADEVVAIDVLEPGGWDWPAGSEEHVVAEINRRKARGAGFELAAEALGSKVKRLERSVYDLSPDVDGLFDFVYVGSLLLHLRDPVGALTRVRGVCRGEMLVVDAIDLGLTAAAPGVPLARLDAVGRPWWWKPNLAGLRRMIEAAGFRVTGRPRRTFVPPGIGQPRPAFSGTTLRNRAGREALFRSRRGDPHGVILARPV